MRRDGRPLALTGLRQRALLAFLVLHAGELVSSDRLIVALFGEDASSGAANALQQAVSRLRRTLGDDGAPDQTVLVTRPPGYVLEIDPDRVDLKRFELLVAQARERLERGELPGAANDLRDALSLWRGPPLADLTELEFAQGEIRRLEELRLGAVMDRIDAELALGRGPDLVAELEGLVAGNPYQERVRGQLMLALYRSGRQTDALQTFREARELLRDELGLEPSRTMQELERAILVHDAKLDLPVRGGPEEQLDVTVCPFKGLASFGIGDSRFFCGRERIVDDLVARLAENALVGVVGPSGIGKSSVLRAGLLRALALGALPGSEGWPAVVIRPGGRPRLELESALEETRTADRYVLAVDQLEELFTVCDDEEERRAFIDGLVAAVHGTGRRAVVALALRADFYGRCANYPELARLLSGSHVLVGPMQRTTWRARSRCPRNGRVSRSKTGSSRPSSMTSWASQEDCRSSRRRSSSCGAAATARSCGSPTTARRAACTARSAGSPSTRTPSSMTTASGSPGGSCCGSPQGTPTTRCAVALPPTS